MAADASGYLERHYENVLGTSLDLVIYGGSNAEREAAAEAAIAEIARLEQILSVWRDDSEITTLNRTRAAARTSGDLLAVVEACESWMDFSGGAFSCRMGQVARIWDEAEASGQQPVVPDTLPVARAAQQSAIVLDRESGSIELGEAIDLDPAGLAKGYIIDRAMAVLREDMPEGTAIKLDIGGDGFYWGAPPGEASWQVQVADPFSVTDNANFVTTLGLSGMAVATSGHRTRTWDFGDRQFSKILDTRRGWPVDRGLYSIVIAPDALSADAMATLLATQFPEAAIDYANSRDGVEALVIDNSGNQYISSGWQGYLGGELRRQAMSVIELSLEYTIPDVRSRDYERPYLAVWVSDENSRPVKNLLLLGSEERWAQTNTVWWSRVGRRKVVPTNGVTRPTREPGRYRLSWDGRDDDGNIMLQGDYYLMIEASREHGGHDYMNIPFTLEEGNRAYGQAGSGELGDVSFTVTLSVPE